MLMQANSHNFLVVPENWSNPGEYLHNRKLIQHKAALAGLPFLGYLDNREAYRLHNPVFWTKKKLNALHTTAEDFNGVLKLGMYPQLKVNGRFEPLLEIIDWLDMSLLLIPTSYGPKLSLVEAALQVLELD